NGHLSEVPVDQVGDFEEQFLAFMDAQHPEVGKAIAESGAISEETESALKAAIDSFLKQFTA
ncbi:MAG: F0F1 ATP synthase subunit alpha, partial [Candidatus Krumholzibacteria bacterium]|nr:F0F1 ATP synthase subunit alpha [Candidatus Krumholzibacteria bacterium]